MIEDLIKNTPIELVLFKIESVLDISHYELNLLSTIAENQDKFPELIEYMKEKSLSVYLDLMKLCLLNVKYHVYLELFSNTPLKVRFDSFNSEQLSSFLTSISLFNYEDSYFDFEIKSFVLRLVRTKRYNDAELFLQKYPMKDIVCFELAVDLLKMNHFNYSIILFNNIKDWTIINKKILSNIYLLVDILKENNSDVLNNIKDKIEWCYIPYVLDFKEYNHTDDYSSFLLNEKQKIINKFRDDTSINGDLFIKEPPKFEFREFPKSIRKLFRELIVSGNRGTSSIIRLFNDIYFVGKLFNIDYQLFIPVIHNFQKNSKSFLNDLFVCSDVNYELIKFLDYYNHKKIINILFSGGEQVYKTKVDKAIKKIENLNTLGYSPKDFFIKKPKSLDQILNYITLFSDKCEQSNIRFNQINISYLDGKVINGYLFKLPVDSYELIHIGSSLNICIGNRTYADRVISKKSNIALLYNELGNDLIGAIELVNGEIIQAKGLNNINLDISLPNYIKKELKPL